MNKLILVGIVFTLGGLLLKFMDIYYEKKVLPNRSLKEQEEYKRLQNELSKKGAYNVPFKDKTLISKSNTVHDRNNFIIILGIVVFILGLISS